MATANKDYFLDEKKELTDDANKGAFLLIRKGQEIPQEMADEYGIGKVAQTTEESEAEPVEEKAAKPSKNKAKTPAEDK